MPDGARSDHPGVQAQLDRLAELSPGGDRLGLERILELTEALGGVSYVHLTAPSGEKLIVERHDQIAHASGTMVGVGFDSGQAMLFDKDGARLR